MADVADALKHVCGYAIGLDMTRRDLQFTARDKGASLGVRQVVQPPGAQLIWSIPECAACLSQYETLEPGDVMLGAIAGVGEITVSVAA